MVMLSTPVEPVPMADATSPGPFPAETGGERPNLPIVRVLSFWGFAALVVLAAVFWVWWGLSYGVWTDNGEFSVIITLAAFGLAGMWLMTPIPPVKATEPH
jgi:hypothetical protein